MLPVERARRFGVGGVDVEFEKTRVGRGGSRRAVVMRVSGRAA